MLRITIAALSASLLAGGPAQTQGQQQPGFTPQELDRMSQQRMEETGFINRGPPVPLSSVPKLRIFQPSEPWICKSTKPWQPVYSEPNLAAPKLGETQSHVAVGGRSQNGFARILFPNGKIGWIPANQVRDFVSDVKPGASCQVEGVRANGGPVFGIE